MGLQGRGHGKTKRDEVLAKATTVIQNAFDKCPFNARKTLFKELENWANQSMGGEAREIFLEALYNAKCTQDVQLMLVVEKAIGQK